MRKLRQMQAALRSQGYGVRRGKGSHQIWTHPALPGRGLVLCGTRGSDVLKYQETRLKKQQRQLSNLRRAG